MTARNTVFIQANARQMLGAKISAQSYKKASSRPDSFDVRIMDAAVVERPASLATSANVTRLLAKPSGPPAEIRRHPLCLG